MLQAFKRMFARPTPATVDPAPARTKPDPKGPPGTRVYHEYFLDEQAGRVAWLCRVYPAKGDPIEYRGVSPSVSEAKADIAEWAERTKALMRG